MKAVRYRLEAGLVILLMGIFRILPLDTASAFGGFIGRTIGPHLGASKKALRHIALAFPDMDATRRQEVLRGMWENLGRNAGEYPHLREIARNRTEFVNSEIGERLKNDGVSGICFGCHQANWEMLALYALEIADIPFAFIYREPNNPYVARMLTKGRDPQGKLKLIPKSRTGARDIVRTMNEGTHIGILIDQKYNEGIAAPFFGHPAMTSTAFADLGQKFKVPVIPMRVERTGGAHFRVTLHEPLPLTDENGTPYAAEKIVAMAHAYLEDWITARPEQWLWLHRRWIDDRK